MSIAQKLKDRTLELRKARDPLASTFQMIVADAQATAKAVGMADFNDDQAVLSINRGIKQTQDVIDLAGDNAGPSIVKKQALEALLPQKASEDEVRTIALHLAGTEEVKANPRGAMGVVMKGLSAHFGAALDKSVASSIAKEVTAA